MVHHVGAMGTRQRHDRCGVLEGASRRAFDILEFSRRGYRVRKNFVRPALAQLGSGRLDLVLMTEPQNPKEWQEAIDAAEFYLALDSARQYGLLTGGPTV